MKLKSLLMAGVAAVFLVGCEADGVDPNRLAQLGDGGGGALLPIIGDLLNCDDPVQASPICGLLDTLLPSELTDLLGSLLPGLSPEELLNLLPDLLSPDLLDALGGDLAGQLTGALTGALGGGNVSPDDLTAFLEGLAPEQLLDLASGGLGDVLPEDLASVLTESLPGLLTGAILAEGGPLGDLGALLDPAALQDAIAGLAEGGNLDLLQGLLGGGGDPTEVLGQLLGGLGGEGAGLDAIAGLLDPAALAGLTDILGGGGDLGLDALGLDALNDLFEMGDITGGLDTLTGLIPGGLSGLLGGG